MQMAARAWGIEGTRPSQSEVGNLVCATDARRLNTCYNMQWYDLLMYLQVAMSTMHGCIFLRTRDQKSMHLFSSLLVFVSVSTVRSRAAAEPLHTHASHLLTCLLHITKSKSKRDNEIFSFPSENTMYICLVACIHIPAGYWNPGYLP